MGPTVLLDKSALQGLSQKEVLFLFKHYLLSVPRVLLVEILGDLSKHANEGRGFTPEIVRVLAEKIQSPGSYIAADHRDVCVSELFDRPMPTGRQIPVSDGRPVRMPDGSMGMFLDEPPEMKDLTRWRRGEFQDVEAVAAVAWRRTIATLDPKDQMDRLMRDHIIIPRCSSIDEVARAVDGMLREPGLQVPLLHFLLDEFGVAPRLQRLALRRSKARGVVLLRKENPYAKHCLRVLLIFSVAASSGLLGKRPTKRVDLDYCFYTPFCHAFSSNDRFHTQLAPHLLDPDQTFIPFDALKADLRALADAWESLSDEERDDSAYNYGDYPPDRPDSITSQLWKKHMRPWAPGSGNRLLRMTEEEVERLTAHVKSMIAAIKRGKT